MKLSQAGFVPACVIFLVACASRAHAADALTLGHALDRAVAGNPSLAASAAESDAVTALAAREALGPAFTLGADVENVAGTGSLRGTDAAEYTARLGRVIELGGKRAARIAAGDAEVARSGAARMTGHHEVLRDTTLRFIEVAADQERLALAAERVRAAGAVRVEVARSVESARIPETDLRAAELALADAQLELEHSEHELESARVALATCWGALEPDFENVSFALGVLPPAPALRVLADRLGAAATLASAARAVDAATARRRLAETARSPDLDLSIGVRRLEAFDSSALVFSASMPLGTRDRGGLEHAEATARLRAAEHQRAALHADLYQRLFEKYQELVHARTERELLAGTMLPKAQASLALAQRGFEMGRFPFFTFSQAQQSAFDLRRREIDAAARYHSLLAELEQLTAGVTGPGAP